MEIPIRFAYLFLNIGFGILWVVFFIFYPKTRRLQLLISLLAVPLGPVIEYLYFQDYWYPLSSLPEIDLGPFRILAEDLAFAFFFTGTTAMLAHVTGKKVDDFRIKSPVKMVGVGLLSMLISISLVKLGLNSILSTSTSFLLIAVSTVLMKKDGWKYALRCGLATVLMVLAVYEVSYNLVSNIESILKSAWFLYDNPVLGKRIFNIPMTELIWAFSWGNMMGAVRHYLFG